MGLGLLTICAYSSTQYVIIIWSLFLSLSSSVPQQQLASLIPVRYCGTTNRLGAGGWGYHIYQLTKTQITCIAIRNTWSSSADCWPISDSNCVCVCMCVRVCASIDASQWYSSASYVAAGTLVVNNRNKAKRFVSTGTYIREQSMTHLTASSFTCHQGIPLPYMANQFLAQALMPSIFVKKQIPNFHFECQPPTNEDYYRNFSIYYKCIFPLNYIIWLSKIIFANQLVLLPSLPCLVCYS